MTEPSKLIIDQSVFHLHFEKFLFKQMSDYFNNILSEYLSGLKKGYGCYHVLMNTYWTRLSPASSLLRLLDEVKSNKCFIIPNKIGSNKLVVWKMLVSIKVTVT